MCLVDSQQVSYTSRLSWYVFSNELHSLHKRLHTSGGYFCAEQFRAKFSVGSGIQRSAILTVNEAWVLTRVSLLIISLRIHPRNDPAHTATCSCCCTEAHWTPPYETCGSRHFPACCVSQLQIPSRRPRPYARLRSRLEGRTGLPRTAAEPAGWAGWNHSRQRHRNAAAPLLLTAPTQANNNVLTSNSYHPGISFCFVSLYQPYVKHFKAYHILSQLYYRFSNGTHLWKRFISKHTWHRNHLQNPGGTENCKVHH